MRLAATLLLFILAQSFTAWGQTPVTLDQWPTHLQLYPRDKSSQCTVAIAGRVPVGEVKVVSLVVFRDQKPYRYARVAVDSLTGHFAFNPIIKAGLNEYSFRLFTHRLVNGPPVADSVRVAVRDSIVCGDVFLIMGQSNAVGRFDDKPYRSEFGRTFGVNHGNDAYNPADTAWCLTNTTEGNNSLWGVELQRLITERDSIPTAVINGAVGSTSLFDHTNRDSLRPDNLATLYGRLLYRVRKAGVASRVRAMIWRQGEAEAVNDPDVYARLFPKLYGYWKRDYPGLEKIYHTQLNLLADNRIRAGAERDYQRRSNAIFGDNEPIATVGLPDYQGLHYGEAGYRQFGAELYRLVARDFYGSADTSNIRSPNIRRIFYGTPARDEITLEFDPGQVMRWPADTLITNPANGHRYTQRLSGFMYADYPNGDTIPVKSVTEQGNRLILKLSRATTINHLTYLPSSYKDDEVGYYVGPVLRNRRGMRALTFFQVPIATPLPVASDLRAVAIDTSAIRLTWGTATLPTSATVDEWGIERADSGGTFKPIARVPGASTTFDDGRFKPADTLRVGPVYQYRIRAMSRSADGAYSPVVTASLRPAKGARSGPESALLTDDVTAYGPALIYPNPASDQVRVRLPPDWTGDAVTLTLTTDAGGVVQHRTERVLAGTLVLTFSVATLPTGVYVLTMQYPAGGVRCRLVIVR